MPRPSKRVAPDTLGGRLRTARQNLHLSLAEVAGNRYSTSLISQIERNRVDPSSDSLQYLADRLKLPIEDLLMLARQHRQSETEANLYKAYEEKYAEIHRLLARNQSGQALEKFKDLDPVQLPLFLRWRTLALRGQSHFEQRRFVDAQRDFLSSLTVLPPSVSDEEQLEVVTLRLHLAAATRELNQFKEALQYYKAALATMNASTPLRYVAEAHWGLALVYYLQAQNTKADKEGKQAELLQQAWQHAEDARTLYNAIADAVNAALLQCQMALIEQTLGHMEAARKRLTEILEIWLPTLKEDFQQQPGERISRREERANVVSSTACCLAGLECQARHFESAREIVQIAIDAGEISTYTVRRAEAQIRLGEILEAQDPHVEDVEKAFRKAVVILEGSFRIGIRFQAHYQLGRYLLSTGKEAEGREEMEKAHRLAGMSRGLDIMLSSEERSPNGV